MVTIRPAQVADADAIWQVHTASIRAHAANHYRAEQIASWIAGLYPALYRRLIRDDRVWVAEDRTAPIAFVQYNRSSGELEALFVAPTHTLQGIGRRLLRLAEEQARAAGHVQIHLSASANAVTFYERLGYHVVGATEHCLPSGGWLQCTDMLRGLPLDPALRIQERP